MSEPKVSVIMPVYKVERYVARAIESIRKQTLEDFEFLIVDDGSPDGSGAICDAYARDDRRIRVIHKENGGAPSARNAAMKIARGKYFYFMDSDDWAEPDMLSDMVELAERVNAQYVVAGYYIDTYYSDSDYLTVNLSYPDVVYKSRDEFRQNAHRLFDRNLLYTPWNKLYLAEYLNENGITFPQTFWDDFPFNLSVLRDVERVAVTSKQYYHFMRARAESETAKYVPQMYNKREEEHQWMQDLYRHWGVDNAESREFVARRYIERVIGCVENVTNKQCVLPAAEKKGEIRRIICDPKVAQSLKEMHPRSLMMKLMLMPIRLRSVGLTYMQSRLISWVKSRNTRLFASLKAKR